MLMQNVGPSERYVRLGLGVAASVAAIRARGWQRAVLCGVALTGLGTALTRYCPINQAVLRAGVQRSQEEGLRDTELRRQTAVNAALGQPPSAGSDEPPVTPHDDVFGRELNLEPTS